jgi:NTP pyrophosphatase (non-canonical NTP hydrolase)
MTDAAPLTFAAYQAAAAKTDRGPQDSLVIPLLGLFGETGGLLSVVKKKKRDRVSDIGYGPAVVEELGDVLWYLTTVAKHAGIALSDIANNANRNFSNWAVGSAQDLLFSEVQNAPPTVVHLEPTAPLETLLLDMAGEVGSVLADYQAGRINNNQAALAGRLVAVFRMLLKAGSEAGVTLEEAAQHNLWKIHDRWPEKKVYPAPFDEKASKFEQLPRDLVVEIYEREVRGQVYVFQRCCGVNIGDRLTDNSMTPDDYRFHDVFHYAYAAVLGWSPVLRALMSLKRKSEPLIDEAQDGARAVLIEEGITTWIFGQAQRTSNFETMKPGELSFDLLKNVRQFVSGYEPQHSPLWLWEDAILQGYEAFRFLKVHRRARVTLDMSKRRLAVEELPFES